MAGKQWGSLCPEGHGLLLEREDWTRQGVMWCPHEDHGGNGRFWRQSEVEEGWFDPTKPPVITDAQRERLARAHERSEEWHRNLKEKERQTKMAKQEAKTASAAKPAKDPQDCLCGCGGQTKGGRFLPGHDARYHSRIRTLEADPFNLSHDEAAKIASKGPLTGKYAVKPAAPAKAPEAAKTKPAKKPAQPDLTARASDEPATEDPGQNAELPPADIPLS